MTEFVTEKLIRDQQAEIERLRAALERIADPSNDGSRWEVQVARAAIAESPDAAHKIEG